MKRVFVVEDEAVVAMEIKDHLHSLGYEVCGHAARAEAALRQIPELRPDLIVMDINLGAGMSGLDVADRLAAKVDVPVIFLTAYSDAELTERAARGGSYVYVLKPFEPRVLKANIELALVRHESLVSMRESEARFRALFEQAAVGVAESDATGRYLQVNRRFCEIMGYTAEELLEHGLLTITHPDDVTWSHAEADRLRRGELHELSVEKRYVRKDGSTVSVHLVASRLWGPGEPPTRYMAVVNDITERKRAEAALKENEYLLSESQRMAHIGSWKVDLATSVATWTDETYRIFGKSRATFAPTAESLLSLLHPEDRASMQSWIAASFAGRPPPPFEFQVVLPDRTVRYLRGHGEIVQSATDAGPSLVGTVQDITDKRRAAAALEASEHRYRHLFEVASDGLFRTDIDGTVLEANPAFARLLGHDSPSAVVGMNTRTFYADPEDRARIQERHVGKTVMNDVQVKWRKHGGEVIRVELNGVLTRGEHGEAMHYQGFVRDVTAQWQHDTALRLLSTGLARTTGDTFFEEIAEQLAAILGVEIGFVGALRNGDVPTIRTLGFAVDGSLRPSIEYALAGTPCEGVIAGHAKVFPNKVQHLFPGDRDLVSLGAQGYVAVPLRDSSGEVFGHVGVIARAPITDGERVVSIVKLFALRTAAELERQRAEERFSSVFELAPDALLIVDGAGRIVLANRLSEVTFGYRREELVQLAVEDLVPEADRRGHVALREGFLASGSLRRMGSARSRLTALRKDGTQVPVEISLGPLRSEDGPLVVAVVRDVSERARDEEARAHLADQLRQAQKMESLGRLAGGIAHDFNNLLAVIGANLELALADLDPADPVVDSLGEISVAASRAADLVKQILAFSRKQRTARSVGSLRSIVEEAVRLLRATLPAGIRIVSSATRDVPSVLLDSTQIHQVLMNMGTNAWHAIPRTSGQISILLDAVSAEAIPPFEGKKPGRYARIRVCDDGTGMDATILERIFEPFFTTKGIGKGTGLGLAVVHGIVADHGGTVTVDSMLGRGTTFSVCLPEAS